MPSGARVRPKKWRDIRVLFDDGDYSVISGTYEDYKEGIGRSLGERWNGGQRRQPLGFPNIAGHPVWHVVPDFLEIPVLQGLLARVLESPHLENGVGFSREICEEISARYARKAKSSAQSSRRPRL
jgi:hypothetical protein